MKATKSRHFNIVLASLSFRGTDFTNHYRVNMIFLLEVAYGCGAHVSGRLCAMVLVSLDWGIVVSVHSRPGSFDMSGQSRAIKCMWAGMEIKQSYNRCVWNSPGRCFSCRPPCCLLGSRMRLTRWCLNLCWIDLNG